MIVTDPVVMEEVAPLAASTAVESPNELDAVAFPRRESVFSRLIKQRTALIGLTWLVLLLIVAIFAPLLAPYDPNATDVMNRLRGISSSHWLGTDDLGRDLLSRAMWGSRIALMAACQVIILAAAIGIPAGLFVGFKGGWWDRIIMRVVEIEQPIPTLLLAFSFVAIFGRGLIVAMTAVGIAYGMIYLRLTRAVVLAERQKTYVQAAEIQGYGLARIMFRHILPNAIGPLIVQTTILAGLAILIEATLSFLGLGAPPGVPSWGSMLDAARRFQIQQLLLSLVPGTLITATVLSFNLVGDGLRDAFSGEVAIRKRSKDSRPKNSSSTASSKNAARKDDAILSVSNLVVKFPGSHGEMQQVLRGISFNVRPGEIFGVVGESGSGKSMAASAVLGMVPSPGQLSGGSIHLKGRELSGMRQSQWRAIRGKDIGVVFQDPIASMSPVHTVGSQMVEGLRRHENLSKRAAFKRAAELLDLVGVPDARRRLDDYPHQFSGGMSQRAMIAAALSCSPSLLIADEPTTALDATVQKQVLELIVRLRGTLGMSVLLITHDLGVVAQVCDRVAVMRHGEIVELQDTADLFLRPQHQYTKELISARNVLVGRRRDARQ